MISLDVIVEGMRGLYGSLVRISKNKLLATVVLLINRRSFRFDLIFRATDMIKGFHFIYAY